MVNCNPQSSGFELDCFGVLSHPRESSEKHNNYLQKIFSLVSLLPLGFFFPFMTCTCSFIYFPTRLEII